MKTNLIRIEVVTTPPKHSAHKRDKGPGSAIMYDGLFHVNIVKSVNGKEESYPADLSPEHYFLKKFELELLAKGISEEDLDKYKDLILDAEREDHMYDNEGCDCFCHG
jgi:uncharacterized protein (UPF0216 family)